MNLKLNRRRFIKGVIASGAVAGAAGLLYTTGGALGGAARGQSGQSGQNSQGGRNGKAGLVERAIRLNVNGQMRAVDVAPQETLAYTLRYKLGLTGTKLGCNRGECGACTVLVDDVPTYSCSALTHSMKAGRIETVEGLQAADGTLHPVQQGFIDELSPQCGYCTPGQVMAAVGLLRANPNPTREEARQGLSGNLCRCGSYNSYLNGVMRAAQLSG